MARKQIKVVVDLDDKKFTDKMDKILASLGKLSAQASRTSGGINRASRATRSFGSSLRDMVITVGLARSALHNLYGISGRWIQSIVQQNAEIERMTFLLKGMSEATTELGKELDAQRNVNWLFNLAKQAPFAVNELSNAFVKFRSVGLDPLNGSMESLVDAVAAFGGNNQVLHRASIAIQQMAGKGVISMEELRQQLGEAVPRAITLMARATGMKYKEMTDLIAKGGLEAKSSLNLMFQEFERVFGGRALSMMDTWIGLMSRLQTSWSLFAKEVGDNQFFKNAKTQLAELVEGFNSQGMIDFADALGAGLNKAVKIIRTALELIYEWREAIVNIGKIIVALYAVKFVNAIKGSVAALVTMNSGMVRLRNSSQRVLATILRIRPAVVRTNVALRMVAATLTTMRGIIASLGGPFGLLVTGAMSLYFWLKDSSEELDNVKTKLEQGINFTTTGEFTAAADELQRLDEKIAEVQNRYETHKITGKEGTWSRQLLNGFQPEFDEASQGQIEQRDRELAQLMRARAQLQERLAVSNEERIARIQDDFARQEMGRLERRLNARHSAYDTAANQLVDALEANEISREEFMERQTANINTYFDATISGYENAIAETAQKLKDAYEAGETQQVGNFAALIKEQNTALDEARKKRDEAVEAFITGPTKLDRKMGLDDWEKLVMNVGSKMAKFKARVEETNPHLAEFEERVRNGFYNVKGQALTMEDEAVKKMIIELNKLWEAEKEYNDWKAKQKAGKDAQVRLNDTITANLEDNEDLRNSFNKNEDAADRNVRAWQRVAAVMRVDYGESVEWATEAMKKFDEDVQRNSDLLRQNNALAEMQKLKESTASITKSFAENRQERMRLEQAEANFHIERMRRHVETLKDTDEYAQAQRNLQEYIEAKTEEIARKNESPMQRMVRDWADTTDEIENLYADSVNRMTDKFIDFVKTGKLEFSDLIEHILTELLKLQLQKSIIGPLAGGLEGAIGGGIDWLAGMFGGPYMGGTGPAAGSFRASQSALGNIIGKRGPLKLSKFAKGGIVDSPHVAIFGEGSMNEAFVPLPDGRSIPVTVQGGLKNEAPNVSINVINQSGQSLDAEQGGMKFDGKQFVLDVVLNAASRPGAFRDGLRGATR